MKIKSNKESGILSVDGTNFAVLTSVHKTGFTYDFTYAINTDRALQKECNIVRIEILTQPSATIKKSVTKDNFLDKLLVGSAEKKAVQRSSAQNIITFLQSDFTAKISNEKTSRLGEPSIKKILQLRQVDEISKRDLLLPVMQRHSFVKSEQFRYDSTRTKELSMSLICDYGIDPALIAETTDFIISPQQVRDGISQISERRVFPNQTKFLVESIIQNSVQPTTQLEIPNEELIATLSSVEDSLTLVTEELEIPFTLFSNFFVRFILLDKAQNEIDSIVRQVDHSYFMGLYKQPINAPYIAATTVRPGKNSIELRQLDARGKKIQVFKKIINNNLKTPTSYKFFAQVDLSKTDGSHRLEDFTPNSNPIIYRAISIGDQNIMGAEFNSAITKSVQTYSVSRVPKKNFLTLTHSVQNNGVVLELRDIPAEITTVKIYRKNLTLKEQFSTLINSPLQVVDQHIPTVTMLDINVKDGNVYEYTCKIVNRFDREEDGNVSVIVEYFKKTQTENVVTKISPPVIIPTTTGLDVNFTISTLLNNTTVGNVQSALQTQGNVAYYTSDLTTVRSEIQNLVAYSVKRTNLSTGEIDDFGILATPSFSDFQVGSLRSIAPPKPGVEYRYTVTTLLRAADTILDINRTVSLFDGRSSYTFKPAKWLHPFVLNQGTLVSSESLASNHAKDEFLYGTVGAVTETVIMIPESIPTISEISVQKINNKSILVQWNVLGDVNKVDHFIIVLSILGMRTIIGKCHTVTNSGNFRYIHNLTNKEQGLLRYSVIPVYIDYTRGTEAQSQNNIVVE